MKAFHKVLFGFVLMIGAAGIASADAVGFGLTVSGGFPEPPNKEQIYDELLGTGVVDPGFLVFFRDRDWGMSFDSSFDFYTNDPTPDEFSLWFMKFDFTMTYDWHLFNGFVIDPLLQVGGGMNLETELTEDEDPEYVRLGFHPLVGAGLDINLGHLYLRGVMQFQGVPFRVPDPSVLPYEISPVRVMLSAGILLD
jgi:hypothetical protein